MAENIFYEAAITYINQGFSIFPLQVKSKKPLTAHGVKDASKDPRYSCLCRSRVPDKLHIQCNGHLFVTAG